MTDNSENNNKDSESLQEKDVKQEDAKETSVEEKLKNTEEKLLRSLAEIENQRRRFEKDVKEAFDFGGFSFAKESLTILDNLQRAKISIKNNEKLKNNQDLDIFLKNLDILEKDLVSIFEKNNINKINSINQKFDPNVHQAMLEVEDEKSEVGTIVQEIQAGYMFKERLLRPSFVGVSKKKDEKEEKIEQKKEN